MEPRLNMFASSDAPYRAMLHLEQTIGRMSDVPEGLHHLVKLRLSQINGCGFCVDLHAHDAMNSGESLERVFSVAAFREAPYFTEAEKAALALAEAAARIADNGEGVPDEVWNAAAKHYSEEQLAQLVMVIAAIKMWNTINVTVRRPASPEQRARVGVKPAK